MTSRKERIEDEVPWQGDCTILLLFDNFLSEDVLSNGSTRIVFIPVGIKMKIVMFFCSAVHVCLSRTETLCFEAIYAAFDKPYIVSEYMVLRQLSL